MTANPLKVIGAGVALLVLLWTLAWLTYPAFAGFHTGFNGWTDHECTTRIIQWCK